MKDLKHPQFVRANSVFVENQFRPETLDLEKPADLCVPALEPVTSSSVQTEVGMRPVIILALGLLLVGHPYAWAAPGDLDPTFGSGGTTPATGVSSLAYSPGDGAIYTANGGTVRRYTSAGVLDTAFGSGGVATIPEIGTPTGPWGEVIVDDIGRILVAGGSVGSHATWVIARLNSNGSLDSSFGTAGVVTVDVDSNAIGEDVGTVAFQSDGKILLTGPYVSFSTGYGSAVVRLSSSGAIDPTFGVAGKIVLPNDYDPAIAVQADDKIVMVTTRNVQGHYNAFVRRLTVDGATDVGFGTAGESEISAAVPPVVAPAGINTYAAKLFLQSDGKIVVVGSATDEMLPLNLQAWLLTARLLADGTLDSSYGAGGMFLTNRVPGGTYVVALAPDDSLIAGPFLLRINSSGVAEPGFGDCGMWATPSPTGAGPVMVQPDGKYVARYGANLVRFEGGTNDVSGEPDADGDGIPDACDLCPATADPTQGNRDGDGFGDACDPCTGMANRIAIGRSIKVSKLAAPAGDEEVLVKGTIFVPSSPPLDPITTGVRVFFGEAQYGFDGVFTYDVTLPGGAYDAVTKVGWKANSSGTSFTYKNAVGFSGVTAVKIQLVGSDRERVKVSVKMKPLTLPAGYPHTYFDGYDPVAYVQLRAEPSTQCGRWDVWAGHCAKSGASPLKTVTCKQKN